MNSDIKPLLSDKVHSGIVGVIDLDAREGGDVKVEKKTQESRLYAPGFDVHAKGGQTLFVVERGWRVILHGGNEKALRFIVNLLGGVSDDFDTSRFFEVITHADKNEISWALLPSAIAIAFHPDTGSVVMLRDSFGFKPLYYSVGGSKLYFGTNIGLVHDWSNNNAINSDIISSMFLFDYSLAGRTIWQSVRQVSPGQLVVKKNGELEKRIWLWSYDVIFEEAERKRLQDLSEKDSLSEIEQALEVAIEPISNWPEIVVPCGGGVDSSLLGAYLAKKGHKVTFWCINQPDAPRSEEEWMRPLSSDLGIPCEYANLYKENFLQTLIDHLSVSSHPLRGPNSVGGILLAKLCLNEGLQYFISGEGCDLIFGGSKGYGRLNPATRLLRLLSLLPFRVRMQLYRSVIGQASWFLDTTLVEPIDQLSLSGLGSLESAEKIGEIRNIVAKKGSSRLSIQEIADLYTWIQFRDVASGLNPLFFEKEELVGGQFHYPFAYKELVRLGLHLPFGKKVRHGQRKFLWRKFSEKYIGKEVAFRKKYGFPTLTGSWLSNSETLLKDGFFQDFFSCNVDEIYKSLPAGHTSKWLIINLELWGRLHLWRQEKEYLLERLM